MTKAQPTAALPRRTKFAYGIGQIAEGVMNSALELTLLFYYTQVLHLSGTLVGLAIFIALLVDAVTDPMVGLISDGWHSKWGRRHPFMYASVIPLCLCFFLLFAPPAGLEGWSLFGWLLVFAVLARFAMTLYIIPHMAQGAELSDDYVERTSIVAWRTVFGALGGVAAVTIIFMVFMNGGDGAHLQLDPSIYPPMAITLGVIIGGSVLVSALGTHSQIWRLKKPDDQQTGFTARKLFAQFSDVASNRNFRFAFGGMVLFFIMAGTHKALGLHMNTYFWELTGGDITILLYAAVVGGAIGIPFTPALTRRFEKKDIFMYGALAVVALQIIPPMARLAGAFPANGEPGVMILLGVSTFFMGVIGMPAAVAANALVADLCDEHEYLTGRRQEGAFFGGIAFSAKAAAGGGSLIGGIALDLIAFPEQATVGTVGAAELAGLAITVAPFAAVFGILSALFYLRITLTRKKLATIQQVLASRRSEELAPSESVAEPAPVVAQ